MVVEDAFEDSTDLRIIDTSGLAKRDGLAWQTAAVAHYIDQGLTDSPLHGLQDSASVLRTINTVRRQVLTGAGASV